jgi:hypothetical protein
MALLFIEGFDAVSVPQLQDRGWLTAYYSFNSVGSGYSRWPTGQGWATSNCLGWIRYDGLKKTPRNEIYLGFAMYKAGNSTPGVSNGEPFLVFDDENNVGHIRVRVTPTYGITVVNNAGTVTLGTTADNLILNRTWMYLEFRVKIHDTAGEVQIRINEQTVLNETGLDTKGAGTDKIGGIYINCIYNDIDVYFDDLYIDDAQFHGSVRVRTFMPDSAGTYAQWTRSGGSNDYECVDEAPSNEDTDYIYSVTKGHKSSFGITTGIIPTVKGMQMSHHLRASASGVRRVRPFVRSGGADYEGPPSGIISADYKYKICGSQGMWQNDPQDDSPWNQTKLEAAEFGLRLVDGTTTTSTTSTTTTV